MMQKSIIVLGFVLDKGQATGKKQNTFVYTTVHDLQVIEIVLPKSEWNYDSIALKL